LDKLDLTQGENSMKRFTEQTIKNMLMNNRMFHSFVLAVETALVEKLPGKTHISLRNQKLNRFSSDELALVLSHLPPRIRSVDLSDNHLDEKTDIELSQLLKSLPAHIEEVDFADNNLQGRIPNLSADERLRRLPRANPIIRDAFFQPSAEETERAAVQSSAKVEDILRTATT
jgi:hypothetical protein